MNASHSDRLSYPAIQSGDAEPLSPKQHEAAIHRNVESLKCDRLAA